MTFDDGESQLCRHLVALALNEDLNPEPFKLPSEQESDEDSNQNLLLPTDRTSKAVIPAEQRGTAFIVARSDGVLSGISAVEIVLENISHWLHWDFKAETPSSQMLLEDGNAVHPGSPIVRLDGQMRCILAAERTALNFLQHLSGIATLTQRFVEAMKGLHCRILDTRKTLPGWRLLEKYAVRCGGGHNHRLGLYDGVLIKDNHLAALGGGPEAIRQAVRIAREKNSPDIPVEVEVENLDLLQTALVCAPDIILLDNMSLDQLREAVRQRNAKSPKIQLEASGGITLDNVRAVAETGVDRISVGALTHSAPALDIALDYETS
jgi:nicotinate-nucleotide pyrophosphorylase (carboxylating)